MLVRSRRQQRPDHGEFQYLKEGKLSRVQLHNCEESVLILEGDAVVVIDGVVHKATAGDTTWLPANVPHYFRNASSEKQMQIFWTYASVKATHAVKATGVERPIAAEHL
jgi:putative monooxygenase